MASTSLQRSLILLIRVCVGWTFLYAGAHQILTPGFSAGPVITHSTTFHWLLVPFADPSVLPTLSFMVKWGHLLIGLSIVSGLFFGASAPFGILLDVIYYMAHMDFPMESPNDFLIDAEHVLAALTIIYLMTIKAGQIYGLDSFAAKLEIVKSHPFLKWLAI